MSAEVHVYGHPEGPMPRDGRWCDELGDGRGVDLVFHRQPEPIVGSADEWICMLCGLHTGSARA